MKKILKLKDPKNGKVLYLAKNVAPKFRPRTDRTTQRYG